MFRIDGRGSTGQGERIVGKGIRSIGISKRVVEDEYTREYKGDL